MKHYLAIDVGQTGCRIARFDDEALVRKYNGPGQTHAHLFPGWYDMQVAMYRDPITAVTHGLRGIEAVCLGVNHSRVTYDYASELNSVIRSIIQVNKVYVSSDIVLAYCGALGMTPGVVTIAGTGVVSLGVDGFGRVAHCNGWGYLLGDQGGGFYVAQRGLAAAMKQHDGRSGSSLLKELAELRYGSLDSLMHRLQSDTNHVRAIAEFAPDVAKAADRGDEMARAIWDDAAFELAQTALAPTSILFESNQEVVVSWSGGLLDRTHNLLEPFTRLIRTHRPNTKITSPAADPLVGGYLIATSPNRAILADLVHIFDV